MTPSQDLKQMGEIADCECESAVSVALFIRGFHFSLIRGRLAYIDSTTAVTV
jgi:hypothetical protein